VPDAAHGIELDQVHAVVIRAVRRHQRWRGLVDVSHLALNLVRASAARPESILDDHPRE
jgi:hypothetical protein